MRRWISRMTSLAVISAVVIPMAACGGTSSGSRASSTDSTAVSDSEGQVLNIQCWNEEFKTRMEDHYPGYEKVDDTTGRIGDVTVKWTITPSDDNAYQNNLDSVLPSNADASADDKVDLFLMEADYALKYVNSDVTMDLADLGITEEDLSDQFDYTKQIVTDGGGALKGASWQACSAGMIYSRQAAADVLGTDDPEKVQEAVSDWDKFSDVAAKAKDKGYHITSSAMDTYRVYSNNVSGPWVQDNKVVVDDNLIKWVNDSKARVDAGETASYDLWSDDWSRGLFPEGRVFCYFGPAWLINFAMHADEEGSIAYDGGWGFCKGPQSFYWGGTWIAAAAGTDNPSLDRDIILRMTTDKDILRDIAMEDYDCVNSRSVLDELAGSDEGCNAVLGGQNPYGQLREGAENIDMSNISDYDQGCNEEFQDAMKNYFDGNASYDEALAQFYTAIKEKYPELETE